VGETVVHEHHGREGCGSGQQCRPSGLSIWGKARICASAACR
jgi:hypothetical protein